MGNYFFRERRSYLQFILICFVLLSGCATERSTVIEPSRVERFGTKYHGIKTTLVVGKFNNNTNYRQGIFSSGIDQLGNQAKTILKTHLQQTNRFKLVDRENLSEIGQEAKFRGSNQNISGARYAVTGSIAEFGRKETGDRTLFGLFGRGKEQAAYSKVMLHIVDVDTSEVIYSTQGAGEYSLSHREILGTGGTAGYDATLNGKVLNLSITEAVNNIVRDLERGILQVKE